MFTDCPECQTRQTVTIEQLRLNRGLMRCSICNTLFDALKQLSENTSEAPQKIEAKEPAIKWLKSPEVPNAKFWGFALAVNLLLLISQGVYFYGNDALQNPSLRQQLERGCQTLGCVLPSYKNHDELVVMQSALTEKNGFYEFSSVIINQAEFAQNYPSIKLTLLNLNGEPLAQRIFLAKHYLNAGNRAIASNQSFQVILAIAPTGKTIGGYTFELI
ncbi:zinc-ribbon and DUF3426 domain-containing protein [Methylicorpusculum oleiharenae]|uniref:zinc-ribbon and DUF3426 domain-containing protein n=1 Tax=Methylicorpusculum oleiharenae TaxID=1338687 RepID=UPI00135BB624|nr:zinc-ribbon and DUF3426 domain-containing protein [Methylicorpusculum oleiharenae]MCD2450674.1 zinc-ribbon and DUF3426 domain-containing protein [Methylicorpusculum oleiharenae]